MSKKKILIVGLPLFSKRLQEELADFDPKNKYVRLDTYYSKLDKIKGFFLVPFIDVIYSINGALDKSLLISWALFWKKRVLMTWVGSDVMNAKNRKITPKFISDIEHLCEVDWIQSELKELGVESKIQNFASFNKSFEPKAADNNRLTLLSYIPDGRAPFYGIDEFLALANAFPEVNFLLVGGKAEAYEPLPSNVQTFGWVKDMQPYFDQADVCLRYPEHDGLSVFILESLARGKQVMYKFPLPNCFHTPNHEQAMSAIRQLVEKKKNNESLINFDGVNYIDKQFNSNKILGELVTLFNK